MPEHLANRSLAIPNAISTGGQNASTGGTEPYTFKLPITWDGGNTHTYCKHDVLPPHEFVASMHNCPKLFKNLMYGSAANLENFWAQSDQIWEVNHDPGHAIPIGIFEDLHFR